MKKQSAVLCDTVVISGATFFARLACLVGIFIGALILERQFLLADGLPINFDAHSHVARTFFASRDFASLSFSGWTPDWYGGFEFASLYGGLYYWLTGALTLLADSPFTVTKIVVWLTQALTIVIWSQVLPARFASSCAVVVAIFIALCPERSWIIRVVGNYPGSLFLAIWGISFCLIVRREKFESNFRFVAAVSLTLIACAYSHFLYFLATLPITLAFFLSLACCNFSEKIKILIGVGIVLGVALAPMYLAWMRSMGDIAFFKWPFKQTFVAGLDLIKCLAGGPVPQQSRLIVPSHAVWPIMLLICGVPILFFEICSDMRSWFMSCGVAAVCVLIGGPRSMLFASLWLYLCAAIIVVILVNYFFERKQMAWVVWLSWLFTLLGLISLSALSVRPKIPNYANRDDPKLDVYSRLSSNHISPLARTYDFSVAPFGDDGKYGLSSISPMISGRAIPFGAFPHGMQAEMIRNMTIAQSVSEAFRMRNPAAVEAALDWCSLNNVGWLVRRDANFKVEMQGVSSQGSGIYLVGDVAPVIFSTRVTKLPTEKIPELLEPDFNDLADVLYATANPANWKKFAPLLNDMGLERSRHVAKQFFGQVDMAALPSSESSLIEVLDHSESGNGVSLKVRFSESGYARLAYSMSDNLRIVVDGIDVSQSIVKDVLSGAIILPVKAGAREILLIPSLSVVMRCIYILATVVIAIIFGVIIRPVIQAAYHRIKSCASIS